MIHLVTLNPALDYFFDLSKPLAGKIGKVSKMKVESGGKALNVARFLKVLRVPHQTWLGTGGGNDPTHIFYRALLDQEKLKVQFLSDKTPVRSNVVLKIDQKNGKFNHPGFETDITYFSRILSKVKKGDWLVLTGSLPTGTNDSLYASWIKVFNQKGVRTVVDTSGRPLLESLKAKPWFFKVNRYEIFEALGQKIKNLNDAQRLIKKNWLKSTFNHGAITDGVDGALIWCYPQCYWVKTAPVRSDLVVGAGDSFLAGYLKAVIAGKGLKDSAVFAAATGAAVASKGIHGFDRNAVAFFLKSVKVRRVL